MNNLNEKLQSMLGRIKKEAKDREEKIAALDKQQAEFWEKKWEPARRKLFDAIDKYPGHESQGDPSNSRDATRSFKVLNRQRDEVEFTFRLNITRDDLKLFIEFNNDEKKYPLEEITENDIYNSFFEQYEKALREKLIPK